MKNFIVEILVLTVILIIVITVDVIFELMVEKHGWSENWRTAGNLMFFWGGALHLKFCQWLEAH